MRGGAAVSRQEDVRIAARDAAARALDAADLDGAGCLLVGATPEHLDEAIDLCAELRDVAGAPTHIFGGATAAAFVPRDAEAEEGPAPGGLALEQPGFLFSFRPHHPPQPRAAAPRARPGAVAP